MLGTVYTETGMLLDRAELQFVHIKLAAGETVKPHDHKGQEVFFTIVKGEVEVTLGGTERHTLTPGRVLHFPGETTIGVEARQESEFFVYLINRR